MAAISVVITTFNRAALLQATLEALREQRYEPGDELIIVDNASTDQTLEIVQRAATGFKVPVRYLKELDRGKSPALNAGIATARGEILALTDDDVIVAEDWIETIRTLFREPSLVLAGGRVDPWWQQPPPRWLGLDAEAPYGNMASPLALLHYGDAQPLGDRTAVGANLVVRRWAADVLGGFARDLGRRSGTLLCGEDHEFCQRAVAAGYRCEYRPELRVRHWVPLERLRLRYYLRWFFWSGVTNAVLARHVAAEQGGSGATPAVPRYLWRELARSPGAVLGALAGGRGPQAAERAMDAAFALGYVWRRLTDRWTPRKPPLEAGSRKLKAGSWKLEADR